MTMEMSDREKVLKGLELCDIGSGKIWCYESDCPYSQNGCTERLKEDALELLKAQEPRVLTWEEAKKAEVCWLEQRGYEPFATLEADTWNPETYGKNYRCWNRMPTDEQRKAVKWNGV